MTVFYTSECGYHYYLVPRIGDLFFDTDISYWTIPGTLEY